jgi:ABC-2 type transport system permease protein
MLLLAGTISRNKAFLAQVAAIGAGATVLWLALFLSFLAGELPAGGSAYLALAIVSLVPVFAGVGALTSQLAPAKRMATGLATGVLVIALALRDVADSSSGGLDWLHWATPLGWAEELRPFADPRPLVLLAPVTAGALLLAAGAALAARRDVGTGVLPSRDSAPPRLRLLGSPAAQALRSERGGLVAWICGVAAFAVLTGVISTAVATTREEAEGRLEPVLARPVGRAAWFRGRLLVAAAGAVSVALTAGLLAWAGAAMQGADVSLAEMLGAGASTLPSRSSSSPWARSPSRWHRARVPASPTVSSVSRSRGRCSALSWKCRDGSSRSRPSTTSASSPPSRSTRQEPQS